MKTVMRPAFIAHMPGNAVFIPVFQSAVAVSAFNAMVVTGFAGALLPWRPASGFEISFTIPDKILSLSFRYRTQRVANTPDKAHLALFELSWSQ